MQNISSIGYLDIQRASSRGSAQVSVHRQLAARVMSTSLIPDDYKVAFRLWTWIWLSLVPVALVIGSTYSWWWTPVLMAMLVTAQSFSRSKTASMFIVDYAKEDELFYDIMVTLGVMRVSERSRS
jgi:predicted permease